MALHANTDKFSYADTNAKLISYSASLSRQEANAKDEKGNVMCHSLYDTSTDFTNEYVACSDTAIKVTGFGIGKLIDGAKVNGFDVSTAMGERPKITITGKETNSSEGDVYTPSISITGEDEAQELGITLTGTTAINSSTISVSAEESRETAQGSEICLNQYGVKIECSMDLISCDTGGVGYTVDTGWSEPSNDDNESEGEYPTKSVTVFKYIATPDA
ncbi:hypothetical protein P0Y35_11805 [Kiritimatiellaeota bacterium B1221]|nr:hypothetical protein [Kiritimatiellaeota bacterium B1221]